MSVNLESLGDGDASSPSAAYGRKRTTYARNSRCSIASLPAPCITARWCAGSRPENAHWTRLLATAPISSGIGCAQGSWCRAPSPRYKRSCLSAPSPTISAPRNSWPSGSGSVKLRFSDWRASGTRKRLLQAPINSSYIDREKCGVWALWQRKERMASPTQVNPQTVEEGA